MSESVKNGSAFGALLRRHREAVGLTQEELAERSGLSVRAISDLERGRTSRPYRRSVASLAGGLGLDDDAAADLLRTARRRTAAGSFARLDVPRQLPAALPNFTGRADETKALDELLEETAGMVVICAISGMAGIGKTALAVHWARRVAERFPDGQLYVNLRGFDPSGSPTPSEQAIHGLLAAFGIAAEQMPSDIDAAASLYRTTVAGRRLLILLDNARDAAQVRPLLPGTPGCLVLVTSRHTLAGLVADGARLLSLDVLTTDESRQFLIRRLGPARIAAEPDAVIELIAACARLPLALAVVAARAAVRPEFSLATLAAELQDARLRLSALNTGDPSTSVPAVFSWSFQQLSAGAARMFRLLGVHPGPDVSAPAAASLAEVSREEARTLLAELCAGYLLTEHVAGRFTFHDLLRAYACQLAKTDPEHDEAIYRMLDHYLHTAYQADRLTNPYWDPANLDAIRSGVCPEELADRGAAVQWLTAEEQVLLASVYLAAAHGLHAHALQLADVIRGFLIHRGHWHDLLSSRLAALAAAQCLGDRVGLARANSGAGLACVELDQPDKALVHVRAADVLFSELGDLSGKARNLFAISELFSRQGDHLSALQERQRALELFRRAGDQLGQAWALNNIGWVHGLLGRYDKALQYCQQAVGLHQQIGDTAGEAYTVDSLGYARHQLGQFEEALACYQRAINLNRETSNYRLHAEMQHHLGDTHWALGDADAAREAWSHAAVALDETRPFEAEQVRAKLHRAAAGRACGSATDPKLGCGP
jgi:tetratricopeptide (TPR) repeat protein/transcriptional regulator with XRE-family HTH domain